jgi:hypothetical protein
MALYDSLPMIKRGTTNRSLRLMLWIGCATIATLHSGKAVQAADKQDYSGKYALQPTKTPSTPATGSTLEVVQTSAGIEVTTVESGKRATSRCPFDGSEGDYTSPGGVTGKCKAQIKGKYLFLESLVVTRPQPAASPVRIHTKERWQLSADGKSLTIKSDSDFPDAPAAVSAAVGGETSSTEKYTRIENP